MNFAYLLLPVFRRSPDGSTVNEIRPHFVPLNEEAEQFVVAQRMATREHDMIRDIFGPFYLGGLGEAMYEGRWVPTFRMISGGETKLNDIEGAFWHWQDLTEIQRRGSIKV